MLYNEERQVAPSRSGIRRDHVARYEFAAALLPEGGTVIDAACGVGYGTQLLAEAGHQVIGIDYCQEALDYARHHYAHSRTGYVCHNLENGLPFGMKPATAAVCFETIEHLQDPRPLLKDLRRVVSGPLLASVPNEDVFPYRGQILHHFRHYTRRQFLDLLAECGWRPVSWHGQEHADSSVEPGLEGRTLIAVCEPAEAAIQQDKPKGYAPAPAQKPLIVPKHVTILGLGPSLEAYLDIAKRLGGRHAFCDEVWGINAVAGVVQCDRVFHMDDVRIQEIRAKARPQSNIARMLDWMRHHPGPIYTSRAHPDYPGLVEFPLEDVVNDLEHPYLNNTAAYALAYAIHLGVEKVTIFGCDYTYPDAHDAEQGRGCLEFWCGMAAAKGIKLAMPKVTSLMDACYPQQRRLYGYDTLDVDLRQADGHIRVNFTERTDLPTADEIEDRYDHEKHPNPLVYEA